MSASLQLGLSPSFACPTPQGVHLASVFRGGAAPERDGRDALEKGTPLMNHQKVRAHVLRGLGQVVSKVAVAVLAQIICAMIGL
ncbi:hypothetical protein GCM10010335_64970 [Streptomyces galbus]|nr:hypothetical protein GCM10010335_64970 [Streptomyces galbus]